MRKQAHKYNLKATFINGIQWELDILAINVTWVFLWFNDNSKIKSVEVNLIQENFCSVKENFGARDMKDMTEADFKRL